MSQVVLAPVAAVAAGVAPWPTVLVFDQQFHVGGGADVDPAGVAGAGGQGVAEAGVGVEAEGQLVAGGGGRGRAGGDRGRAVAGAGGVGLDVQGPGAGWRWTGPAYSTAATPMSAVEVALAVMVGLVPPPAVIGAVQTDISVLSEALKWVSSV